MSTTSTTPDQPAVLVRLTLRPLPGDVPPDQRLKRALKALLRGYGLKCVRVEDVPTESTNHPAAARPDVRAGRAGD